MDNTIFMYIFPIMLEESHISGYYYIVYIKFILQSATIPQDKWNLIVNLSFQKQHLSTIQVANELPSYQYQVVKPSGSDLVTNILSFSMAECLDSSSESSSQQWIPDKIKAFGITPCFVLNMLLCSCVISRLIKSAFRYQRHSFGLPIFQNCEPNKSIFDKFQGLRCSAIETPNEFPSNPRREVSHRTGEGR